MTAALELVDPQADPVRAGMMWERLGRFRWGADQDGRPACEEAIRLVPIDPPSAERARVLAGYAQILMLAGETASGHRFATEAVEMAVRVGAREAEGHARNTLGTCLVPLGQADAGLGELRVALAIAEELGAVEDIGRGMVNLCHSLAYVGRWEELIEVAEAGLAFARRAGIDRTYGVFIEDNLIDGLLALGRWDEAVVREASVRTRAEGVWSHLFAPVLAADRGDFELAHRTDGLLAQMGDAASLQGLPDVVVGLVALAIWEGRPTDVAVMVDAVLDRLPEEMQRGRGGEMLWRGTWAGAEVALAAGDQADDEAVARAVARIGRDLARLESFTAGPSPSGVVGSGLLPLYRLLAGGEAGRAVGRDRPEQCQEAIEMADACRMAFASAYGRFREAESLVRIGGPRADAAALLADAAERARALRARPLGEAIAELGRRARLSGPDPVDGAPTGVLAVLSPREREVLTLVAKGRSNRQIAEELYISPKTASVHVSNILSKLGVSSRDEAAAVAHRLGVSTT